MQVIHPPVKPDPRVPLRAWIANGCLVECDHQAADETKRKPPGWLLAAALAVGMLIGWGLR